MQPDAAGRARTALRRSEDRCTDSSVLASALVDACTGQRKYCSGTDGVHGCRTCLDGGSLASTARDGSARRGGERRRHRQIISSSTFVLAPDRSDVRPMNSYRVAPHQRSFPRVLVVPWHPGHCDDRPCPIASTVRARAMSIRFQAPARVRYPRLVASGVIRDSADLHHLRFGSSRVFLPCRLGRLTRSCRRFATPLVTAVQTPSCLHGFDRSKYLLSFEFLSPPLAAAHGVFSLPLISIPRAIPIMSRSCATIRVLPQPRARRRFFNPATAAAHLELLTARTCSRCRACSA